VIDIPKKILNPLTTSSCCPVKQTTDSNPSHAEAPMLGRPGVRLPYLKYFGLHYRIDDEDITITMMPSIDWSIPNAEFISILEKELNRLKEIIISQ